MMYFPSYQNSILNLMGSIAEGFGKKTNYSPLAQLNPEEIRNAKNVILVVLDGLGYEYLTRYGKNSELAKYLRSKMTSIFPATTTTCIPGFLTGMSSYEHGMAAWYTFLREIGMVVVPLRHVTRFGEFPIGAEVKKIYNLRPFTNLINAKSYVLNPKEFYKSEFNLTSAGKSDLIGYRSIEEMFGKMSKLVRKPGKQYIYAYHNNPDKLMHENGNESKKVLREFNKIDRAFKKFLNKIKNTNSIVIVTADHGLITVPREKQIDTLKYPQLIHFLRMPLCGEGRAGYAYVIPRKKHQFESFAKNKLKFCCEVIKSEDALKRGWFGRGKMHHEFKHRIGDYILLMKDNYAIKDFMLGEEIKYHMGVHGGTSKEEMFVPLIVVKR